MPNSSSRIRRSRPSRPTPCSSARTAIGSRACWIRPSRRPAASSTSAAEAASAASCWPPAPARSCWDVSPPALELAAVNMALAKLDDGRVTLCESDVLSHVAGQADVIIANPPYVIGPDDPAASRLYRDGGGELGITLATRIVLEALDRLARAGGRLVLYTGVPIVD